ncbi:hypothetical protein ACA910_006112 [Epithemia clementina (nom. ined.)]
MQAPRFRKCVVFVLAGLGLALAIASIRYSTIAVVRSSSLVEEKTGIAAAAWMNISQVSGFEKKTPSWPEALMDRIKYYKNRYNYKPSSTTAKSTGKSRDDLCGSYPHYENWFHQLDFIQRSSNNEDQIIYNTFFKNDTTHGTYVEIGAFDGVQESNTRFFDVCLGWSGLLVEGNPVMWDLLVRNRPNAHRMNFVPSCSLQEHAANKTVSFHPRVFTNAGVEAQDRGVRLAYNHLTDVVQVPCGNLWQVFLDVFPQGRVSFWSLDVEGSEHLILEKMDFNKVFVEMLMVEVQNSFCRVNEPCESRDRSREILQTKNGYIRFSGRIPASDIFIHPLSTNLLEKAKNAGWKMSEFQ